MSRSTKYAENTTVSSAASRDEIERTLIRFGASQFVYGWQDAAAVIGFVAHGRQVRFVLPLPSRDDPEIKYTPERRTVRSPDQQEKVYEQMVRQKWRALAACIKAKFAAIEAGISVFEREFFYDTVLPNGQTVGEYLAPQLEQAYQQGTMPALLPSFGGEDNHEA